MVLPTKLEDSQNNSSHQTRQRRQPRPFQISPNHSAEYRRQGPRKITVQLSTLTQATVLVEYSVYCVTLMDNKMATQHTNIYFGHIIIFCAVVGTSSSDSEIRGSKYFGSEIICRHVGFECYFPSPFRRTTPQNSTPTEYCHIHCN